MPSCSLGPGLDYQYVHVYTSSHTTCMSGVRVANTKMVTQVVLLQVSLIYTIAHASFPST